MLLCGLQKEGVQIKSDYYPRYLGDNCKYQLGCHGSCDEIYDTSTGLDLFSIETNSVVRLDHVYYKSFCSWDV